MGNTTATPAPGETPDGNEHLQGETPPKPNGETPGSTTDPTPSDESAKEVQRLQAALRRANAEAKEHREKSLELDRLKAEAEAAKLSESEKLQQQLTILQAEKEQAVTQAKELRVGSAVQIQAMQAGIDPTLARKLITNDEIEYDEGGNPSNIADLLKALVKAYPTLVGKQAAPTSGGATNPPRSASTAPQELSWEVITQLQKNPEEYNRRNANGEISRWLHQHPYRYGSTR